MTIQVDLQTVVTAGAVVTAALTLLSRFATGVRWFDRQKAQDGDIAALKKQHDEDVKSLREALSQEMQAINAEQQLLTYGVLACLKGLNEQGCNGPVTDAISRIEKYLNAEAHKR